MLLCASLQEAIPTTERSSMTTISNSPGIKVDRGPAYDVRARAIILACADAATQLEERGKKRTKWSENCPGLDGIRETPLSSSDVNCDHNRRKGEGTA